VIQSEDGEICEEKFNEIFFYDAISNLEKEVGESTCVEKPKKKGAVRSGPYFSNKSCRRVLGSGGSDISGNLCLQNEDRCLRFISWQFQGAATGLLVDFFIVQTTGSMIFQSSFFPFSFLLRSPALCTKDLTFFFG
jgi:hypothetical protein